MCERARARGRGCESWREAQARAEPNDSGCECIVWRPCIGLWPDWARKAASETVGTKKTRQTCEARWRARRGGGA
eukprot:6728932-Prymnesium_polylepis.1